MADVYRVVVQDDRKSATVTISQDPGVQGPTEWDQTRRDTADRIGDAALSQAPGLTRKVLVRQTGPEREYQVEGSPAGWSPLRQQ